MGKQQEQIDKLLKSHFEFFQEYVRTVQGPPTETADENKWKVFHDKIVATRQKWAADDNSDKRNRVYFDEIDCAIGEYKVDAD